MKLADLKFGGYKLCPPTYVYIFLSLISFISILASNVDVSYIILFIIKMLIWVFILNVMCANNLVGLAWFFVLLPFIVLFIVLFVATYKTISNGSDTVIVLSS